jgi:tyrosyl-tRNA synthetase
LAHGRDAAIEAAETARRTFEEGETAGTLPTHVVPADELAAGIPAFRLLVESGLAASNGEARRLIRGGGARLNDAPIADEGQVIGTADLRDGALKLSVGRKQHRLVRAS